MSQFFSTIHKTQQEIHVFLVLVQLYKYKLYSDLEMSLYFLIFLRAVSCFLQESIWNDHARSLRGKESHLKSPEELKEAQVRASKPKNYRN